MGQTLLSLPLRNKRDAMVARQRTRQLTGLLGYDIHDQAGIAAGVFAVAWQILSLQSPVQLSFLLDNGLLKVLAEARRKLPGSRPAEPNPRVLCLERPLPARAKMGAEDIAWAVDRLDQVTPAHMYDEVYRLNQELLAALQALEASQAQLSMSKGEKPSAA